MITVNFLYKIFTPLLLVVVFIINSGYGLYAPDGQHMAIEICDHSDHEAESEDKENSEIDDIFKHDHRDFHPMSTETGSCELSSILGFPSNHLETFTPPPEYLAGS